MNISLKGFNEQVATFQATSGLTAGVPVKISDNGKVAACTDGDPICGVCVAVREGFASVQLSGYVTLPYTGTLSLGWANIVGDGTGNIEADTDGRQVLVTDLDSTNSLAGIIL